jgi:uncharacterized protein YijF (DUF1287 family)
MNRRALLSGLTATAALSRLASATPADGKKLAAAARAQVGVTVGYDPRWTQIAYPNGDVPRSTGVCADVVIRAARDALGLDLQKLVHDDMISHFDAYPARRVWRSQHPDPNIDHRRVLNLETYFSRCGACMWHASSPTASDAFPKPLEPGDILTWRLLEGQLPHIGIVFAVPANVPTENPKTRIIHNIGRGAEEIELAPFNPDRAIGHYRWPVQQ